MRDISRRTFLTTTVAGAGLTIVPRHVLGRGFQAPSDTVNIATVGFGGMGGSNTRRLMSQNIVAICDVDDALVDAQLKRMTDDATSTLAAPQQAQPQTAVANMSKAQATANARRPRIDSAAALRRFTSGQILRLKRYRDYREMLDKQKDIDAIVVATPDHMHAVIALAAMDLNKHVYVQKPLCWSVEEARALAKKAKEKPRVVTQMGNQGHSVLRQYRKGKERESKNSKRKSPTHDSSEFVPEVYVAAGNKSRSRHPAVRFWSLRAKLIQALIYGSFGEGHYRSL